MNQPHAIRHSVRDVVDHLVKGDKAAALERIAQCHPDDRADVKAQARYQMAMWRMRCDAAAARIRKLPRRARPEAIRGLPERDRDWVRQLVGE